MTLRNRLLISVLVVCAALAVAGWSLAQSQRRYLVEQIDQQLLAAVPPALNIARLTLDDGTAPAPTPAAGSATRTATPSPTGSAPTGTAPTPAPSPSGPTSLSELYVGIARDDGTVATLFAPGLVPELTTAPSGAAASDGGALAIPASMAAGSGEPAASPFAAVPFTAGAGDGSSYRAVVVAGPTGSRIVIGLPLDRAEAAYRRLLLAIGGAALAVVAVAAVAGWWVVRLGLRPIRQMTETADAIARGEVGRRVSHPSPRTEAGRLGAAFNVMLDQREGTEARLRRFLSDASHELRTPLTSIRGYVDLYRKGGLDGDAELADAMRRIGGESARMAALVEDLLLLARLDEGRPLADEPVELAALVRDTVSDAAAVQPDRPVRAEVAGPLLLRGDEARLRQVIGAVVTNALVHTAPTAPIAVSARNEGDVHVITVRDEGDGMTAEVAAHAFERFFRGDPARTRNRGGSGLGLSIVRSIVEAHAGTVTLQSAVGVGTTVRIVLPVAGSVATGRAVSVDGG